jgi:hypothetical protein
LTVITDDERTSRKVQQTVDALCPSEPISPWTCAQVGAPAFPSAARAAGDGSDDILLCVGGIGLYRRGSADEVYFAHQEFQGDFRLTARVSDVWSRPYGGNAAVMCRSSLDADAPYAATVLELVRIPPDTFGYVRFNHRRQSGETRRVTARGDRGGAEVWLRLERRGSWLSGMQSEDGETWTSVSEEDLPELPGTLLVGFAASADDSRNEVDPGVAQLQASLELVQLSPPSFLRGDCNGDGSVAGQVDDAIYLLGYNFLGTASPPCLAACDANADGDTGSVSDAIYILSHNFLGGPAPPAPFPECGPGELSTDESLGCRTPPASCPQ